MSGYLWSAQASKYVPMGFFRSLVVLIILTAAGGNALGLQSLLLQTLPGKSTSACHDHGSKAPASKPTKLQCCLVGHDTALPQATGDRPVLYERRSEFLAAPAAKMPASAGSFIPAVDFVGPPETSPLRI